MPVNDYSVKRVDFKELENPARVKKIAAGNVVEFVSMKRAPTEIPVKKLSSTEYLDLRTGEIIEYDKSTDKSDCFQSVRKTLKYIRQLINANCTDESRLLWVTLTYAENMTDTDQLYSDFKKFWQKFKRQCKKMNWFVPEYINVVEPQGRGAWHSHLMLIFPEKAPYIDNNSVIAELWGHGFTKTKAVHGVDNIGAYFSAYLADMPLDDVKCLQEQGIFLRGDVLDKSVEDEETGISVDKKFVKGARLALYPSGMNIVRPSRGIVKPVVEDISDLSSEEIKKEKASSGKLTFSSAVEVVRSSDGGSSSGDDVVNLITREYYNTKRM